MNQSKSSEILSTWTRNNADTLKFLIRTYLKIHSAEQSRQFNATFQKHRSHPTYCYIPKKKIKELNLSKAKVLKLKNKKLEEAIKRNEDSIKYNTNRILLELNKISNNKLKTDIINHV